MIRRFFLIFGIFAVTAGLSAPAYSDFQLYRKHQKEKQSMAEKAWEAEAKKNANKPLKGTPGKMVMTNVPKVAPTISDSEPKSVRELMERGRAGHQMAEAQAVELNKQGAMAVAQMRERERLGLAQEEGQQIQQKKQEAQQGVKKPAIYLHPEEPAAPARVFKDYR